MRTNGLYGQFLIEPVSNLNFTLGGRADDNSLFGSQETWQFAPVYFIEESGTRLKSSIGTAYKAPSLYQLFSEYGRTSLLPERSIGVDVGFEQSIFGEKNVLGMTFFQNNFKNLISFNAGNFLFENINEATTKGIENFIQTELSDSLLAKVSYTFLDAENDSLGEPLFRRAKHKANLDLNYKLCEKLQTHLNILVVGPRKDQNFATFPVETVTLGEYAVVNLSADYQLQNNIKLFARIDNLFDKDYSEVLGFNTPGAGVYAGIKFEM